MKDEGQSYSVISTAYKCPRLYKLVHIDKIKTEQPASSALEFGSCFHAAIQAILEGADGMDVFRTYWDSVKDKDMIYYRHNWDMLNEIGEVLLTRFARLHAKNYKIVHPMEERLFSKIGGYKLAGTPDFVGDYKGVPSIVDFKTSADAFVKDRIICNEQMPLYAYLAEKELGFKAKQLVYQVFTKQNPRIQTIVHPIVEGEHQKMLDNITLMCETLDKATVFPMNRNSCLSAGRYKCQMWEQCYGEKK